MRQIVLDTETTGLSPAQGHRIIEIGCVELNNRRLTGREWHRFINPERDIDEGAERVHGISRASLEDKPLFHEIAEEFIEFIAGAELVIHNAPFDIGFLDHELVLMKHEQPAVSHHAEILDTLTMAREMHPGQRNSLDALCKRYEVDASKRNVHGALIDAELLAGVYLAMTGGQTALLLDEDEESESNEASHDVQVEIRADLKLPVISASSDEDAAHQKMLEKLRKKADCLWDRLPTT